MLYAQADQVGNPYLSSLKATKDSPLYTTYAAAMERSEFILDEGYEFMSYKEEAGIDFTTDTGGDLGLGFLINGKWIYREKDMYKAPIISASYPDMVVYSYFPVKGLRVDATFLVQSSRLALWDFEVTNESDKSIKLYAIPFIRNDYRSFEDVELAKENAVFFTHQEFPDGWTLSHELPHQDTIRNILLFSQNAEKAAFNSLQGEAPQIPFQVHDEKEGFRLSGRALKNEKERVISTSPKSRIQVFLKDDKDKLITENSPLFGLASASIDNQGYFRVDLQNFEEPLKDNPFSFSFYNEEENLYSGYRDTIKEFPSAKRRDVQLKEYDQPYIPTGLKVEKKGSGYLISWDEDSNSNLRYHLYKRTYPEGVYHRIASNLKSASFRDKVKADNEILGYVVISQNIKTGEFGMHSREATNLEKVVFSDFLKNKKSTNQNVEDHARLLAFRKEVELKSGEQKDFRLIRMVSEPTRSNDELFSEASEYLKEDLGKYLEDNEDLFSKIPNPDFKDPDYEMLYWSAFNMMRQVFYPPEAKSSYNYYVFSREPTWGWGHGGQVFHESITMLAYALMDEESAMNSQRVYSERQYPNGYINYRSGSYLDEIIESKGELTSSAPWYAWQNWEVYKITKDREFLEEMYSSSKRFYKFYISNRDKDNDGLCEWGGHAVLESVRDALVAVWDEVGWPANFEGVDLNSMLVKEAKSLEAMANELGLEQEALSWKADYEKRTRLINETFWDEEEGFYFNVDKKDNDFTFEKKNDLKREEIIGFLPLWAGVATPEIADQLVDKLTDSDKFWRKYGVPSLAADDPYYNDKGYWNGPVWVEWNFLIVDGLLEYGFKEEAEELTDRVAEGMVKQLKKDHNLWEFYSPDDEWAGYHKTYIWAGIINRMLMDTKK